MFGDSMFGGEDVNATEIGGGTGGGYSQPSNAAQYSDYTAGQGDMTSGNNQMYDPAAQASAQAEAGADRSTAMANQQQALSVSGAIGHAAGFFSSIEGLVGPRQKRLRKSQRVYSRKMSQAAVDSANRALAQYKDDSQRAEQQLAQSYAGRGIGESSIQQEGMKYFHDQQGRKMDELAQNIALAQAGQRLTHSQISASYANPWLSFGNSITNML